VRNDLGYIVFYVGCFLNLYYKLIVWIMEGRKEGYGWQREVNRLSYGSSFIGNCNPTVREVLYVVS